MCSSDLITLGEHCLLDNVADHLCVVHRCSIAVDRHIAEGVEAEDEAGGIHCGRSIQIHIIFN